MTTRQVPDRQLPSKFFFLHSSSSANFLFLFLTWQQALLQAYMIGECPIVVFLLLNLCWFAAELQRCSQSWPTSAPTTFPPPSCVVCFSMSERGGVSPRTVPVPNNFYRHRHKKKNSRWRLLVGHLVGKCFGANFPPPPPSLGMH